LTKVLEDLIELFTCALVFFMLTLAWHEFCHLAVLKALGGDGYIVYTIYAGYTIITKSPPGLFSRVIVFLSGGLGCAGLFTYFYIFWLEEPEDRIMRFVCLFQIITQVIYAIAEVIWLSI